MEFRYITGRGYGPAYALLLVVEYALCRFAWYAGYNDLQYSTDSFSGMYGVCTLTAYAQWCSIRSSVDLESSVQIVGSSTGFDSHMMNGCAF